MQYAYDDSEKMTAEQRQLAIVSNPLLGCIDCMVSVDGATVEQIRITSRINRPGFEICEVCCSKCRAVQGRTVAFTYQTLVDGLLASHNAGDDDVLQQQLLAMLQHRYFRELDYLGYGVYVMILLSRYAAMDYPFVYWLALLHDTSWQPPEDHDAITRDMLASAMGVASLTNGQMKALRKLAVWRHEPLPGIHAAMLLMARQWEFSCPLVAYREEICPVSLQVAACLMVMQPDLIKAKWFTLDQLELWTESCCQLWHTAIVEETDLTEEVNVEQVSCVLYLLCNIVTHQVSEAFEWADAKNIQRNTAMLMQLQDVAAVERKAGKAAKECLAAFQVLDQDPYHFYGLAAIFYDPWLTQLGRALMPDLQELIHRAWRVLFDRAYYEINDQLYNNDPFSEQYADDVQLCGVSSLVGDCRFSRITTAGHLREVASLLRNCAASRVHAGVLGKSEFWLYRNDLTRESALLQIDKKANAQQFVVVEFNGYANRGVSQAADSHLSEWFLRQCPTYHNPYEARSYV